VAKNGGGADGDWWCQIPAGVSDESSWNVAKWNLMDFFTHPFLLLFLVVLVTDHTPSMRAPPGQTTYDKKNWVTKKMYQKARRQNQGVHPSFFSCKFDY